MDRITVYLPSTLTERLRAMAEGERRALSAQIQILIERALALEAAAA